LPQFLITPVAVSAIHDKLNKGPGKIGVLIFGVILIIGATYAGSGLASDLSTVHSPSILPFLLLGLALLVALGYEFVNAMATIGAADWCGLPVSTTHVLSSDIAGTMAANHSGLQRGTVRNLLMAGIDLARGMVLTGFLFWAFNRIF
jgi:phosphate/sulfate permease